MRWIVSPLEGFAVVDNAATAADSTNHCTCTAGLVQCGPTPGSLVIKPSNQIIAA
jgi:hypothetical protein